MRLKLFCDLQPLSLLNVQHHPERLPGLVRPELVNEVVHVDEEQVKVINLCLALRRLWCADEQVDQVEKVDENRVVQFVQLFLAV
jgi:hypothetical protein